MARYQNSALGRGSAGFTKTVTLHGGPAHVVKMFLQATGTSAIVRFHDGVGASGPQVGPDIELSSGESTHGPSELIQGSSSLSMQVTFPSDDFRAFAHLNVDVETSVDNLATVDIDAFLRADLPQTISDDWTFTGGLWAKGDPVHNVKAYGAVGDGATDDTAAIRAAINAAAGQTVLLTPGSTFLVTGQLTLSDVTLSGYGASIASSYTTTGDEGAVQVVGSGVRIEGIDFDFGANPKFGVFADTAISDVRIARCSFTGAWSHAVAFNDAASNVSVEDCTVSDVVSGIRFRGGVSKAAVRRCFIEEWITYGVEVRGVSGAGAPQDVVIDGNQFGLPAVADPNDSGVAKQPVAVLGASDARSSEISVTNNTAIGAGEAWSPGVANRGSGDQFVFHFVDGLIFTDNISTDGGENGVSVTREVFGAVVSNNVVARNDGQGIQISRTTNPSRDITCVGNVCFDNGQDRQAEIVGTLVGIFVQDAANVVLAHNRCYDTTGTQEYGAFVSTGVDMTVFGNDLAGNVTGRFLDAGGTTYSLFQDGDEATFGSDASSQTLLRVNGAASTRREIRWQTANTDRWRLFVDGSAELGSNAGSDLKLTRHNDNGTQAGIVMQAERDVPGVQFPEGIVADSLRIKGPVFDVTHPDFGATGDGVTDDTTAIQAALDAAATTIGGTVLLGGGANTTFVTETELAVGRRVALVVPVGVRLRRVTSTVGSVVKLSATNARLTGGGRIESAVALTDGIVHVGPDTTEIVEWNRIDDVVIAGPGESVAGCIGLKVAGHSTAGATFQNVFSAEVNNCDIGIQATAGANANDFVSCMMWDIGSYAYQMVDAGQWRIFGGYTHSSPGITVLKLEGVFNGRVIGLGAEAGTGSTGFDIDAACLGVELIGTGIVSDAGFDGTDLGTGTIIIDRQGVRTKTLTAHNAPGSYAVDVSETGVANPAVRIGTDGVGQGRIAFGDGTAPAAVTLREGAGSLVSDDDFRVVGDIELEAAINHDGTTAGFFGTAPVAQPSLPAAGVVTADDIRQALIDLGLCS